MAGVAFMIILAGLGGSWLFRSLLLRTLRDRHPGNFAELGHPSRRQLTSIHPRNQDVQLQFWKFLWDGQVFRLNDALVSALGAAALISDAALIVGVGVLAWSARG